MLADRATWVLKGPYGTRGNSVYVGLEHDDAGWRQVARTAADHGWLAQATVAPSRRQWADRTCYQDLSIVMLRGRWAGYVSRISENFRVNVAQGGGRQIVYGHQDVSWAGLVL